MKLLSSRLAIVAVSITLLGCSKTHNASTDSDVRSTERLNDATESDAHGSTHERSDLDVDIDAGGVQVEVDDGRVDVDVSGKRES